MNKQKLDYHSTVNYDIADPAKVMAQKEGAATAQNMPDGYSEVPGTRGESAYVFNMGDRYGALVQEGLGTKGLVAQTVYKETGESHFAAIAQDTVATVINDLISVGARPVVMNAYWSSSSYDWLADNTLTTGFIKGWREACDKAGVTWGGGETQALSGIVENGALELAGCGFGVIESEDRLMKDARITPGDVIVFFESSGVHANGISLAREIATRLPEGYQTIMKDGTTYGAALLSPTILYARVLDACFKAGLDIHYVSNITGHGWRKIMRGTPELSYIIDNVPTPQPIFEFIQEHSGNTNEEMYGNYNMGAGYALYVSADDATKVQEIAKSHDITAIVAGRVESGKKQVFIQPLDITFSADTLGVR